MTITKYEHNGQNYFKVYVSVRSKLIPRVREQKHLLYDRTGKRISTEAIARAEKLRLVRDLSEKVSKIEGYGLLWKEIIDRWESYHLAYPSQRKREATVLDRAQLMRNWTTSWLNMPASNITRGDARAMFRAISEQGKSLRFQKTIKQTINQIFNWAMEERIIRDVQQSPTSSIELEGRDEERKPEILTREQIHILLNQARDMGHKWFPVWTMAVNTGCRSGELLGLRIEDCSLISKEAAHAQDKLAPEKRNYGNITVQRSWNKREYQYTCTKAKYWRYVPVSKDLYWFLQNLMENDFGNDEYGRYLLPRIGDWNMGQQALVLRAFCEDLKLPSIRFHTLRACFATHLLALGVPSIKVMKAGGWKDLKTMERYTRLSGIDIVGMTEGLDMVPEAHRDVENVVNLHSFRPKKP